MDYVKPSEVALGYEHSVVNMFMIPAGIWMGAPVSLSDWWLWNQLPVTFGNLIGGFLFVGVPMLSMRNKTSPQPGFENDAVSVSDVEPEVAKA